MLSRIGLRMAQSSRLAIRRPVNSPLLTTKRAFTNTASRLQGGQRRQSLKELSKKYGWTAFGVYMSLSALDLPLCFLFVHSMGQERVSEWELNVRKWVGLSTDPADLKTAPKEPADNGEKQTDWGFLLTEFGIAYAIHKSVFIFVRIPLTAAITPWTVKTLRNWGFNIGKGSANGKNLGQPVKKGQRWWWFF